jgi:hypothetical protein
MTLKLEENGKKEEQFFKKNVDYFCLDNGTFYTKAALARKYDVVESTIYKKAKEFNIATENIAGFTCYKDDFRFESTKNKGNIENLKGKGVISYAVLLNQIRDMISVVTEQHNMQNDWNANLSGTLGRLEANFQSLVNAVEKNTEILFEVLGHLTKGDNK